MSRRCRTWAVRVALLLALAAAAAGEEEEPSTEPSPDRCASGQPAFEYASFSPERVFSCCTPAACAGDSPAPCCEHLVGSEANDAAACAALGQLFTNDWGQNTDYPCLAGWQSKIGADVDYDNDYTAGAADATNYPERVTTDSSFDGVATQGHSYVWPPRGWTAAAVGIPTDYCTFHGVRCDDQGRVITLCAPPHMLSPPPPAAH